MSWMGQFVAALRGSSKQYLRNEATGALSIGVTLLSDYLRLPFGVEALVRAVGNSSDRFYGDRDVRTLHASGGCLELMEFASALRKHYSPHRWYGSPVRVRSRR